MIDPNHRPIVTTRLYRLDDACSAIGILPEDLLRLGAAGHLNLCVLVPANTRAYTIAPRSTAIRDAKVQTDKHFSRSRPSERDVPAVQDDSIGALCLSQGQCREVFAFGVSRAWEFGTAYTINPTCTFGFSDPVELRPVRLPLFNPDGSDAPQGHWRFAIYPASTTFAFDERAGFPGPQELQITLSELRVLGRELARVPKLIDSPSESNQADSSPSSTDVKMSGHGKSKSTKAKSHTDKGESEKSSAPLTEKRRKAKRTKADVLASAKSDAIFLDIEEVMVKTKLSRTTIYDYMNPKHSLYDPTFPTQIEIGSRMVGWIAEELEVWLQNRIARSRTKSAKRKK